jgi:hypothetical protein
MKYLDKKILFFTTRILIFDKPKRHSNTYVGAAPATFHSTLYGIKEEKVLNS